MQLCSPAKMRTSFKLNFFVFHNVHQETRAVLEQVAKNRAPVLKRNLKIENNQQFNRQ